MRRVGSSGVVASAWPRIVLHVDMDAFFAAVEQRDHPEWRGLPVVVGADPKRGEGRGVVSTASYEARRFGIRSAMPISQAYRACPDAVFVRPDIERYRVEAGRLRGVFRAFAGEAVEPVSIDEAYLDATAIVRDGRYPDGRAVGLAVKERVSAETGLTCSVGVAPSKSVAKIASDVDKPDGLTVVAPEAVRAFLDPLPVRRLQGVGPKTEALLADEGITRIGDLAARSEAWMVERFGRTGTWLWQLARGVDDRPVAPDEGLAKSRSEEHTFQEDTADVSRIHRVVRGMARDLVEEMDGDGVLFRVVGLKIRTAAFETFTRATTLRAPTRRLEPVLEVLRGQLAEFLDGVRAYRLVGLRLAGLERDVGQRTLEDYVGSEGATEVPLSRFPPWSLPGSGVPRPGQQRLDA